MNTFYTAQLNEIFQITLNLCRNTKSKLYENTIIFYTFYIFTKYSWYQYYGYFFTVLLGRKPEEK